VSLRIFSRGGNDSTFRRSLALPALALALGHGPAADPGPAADLGSDLGGDLGSDLGGDLGSDLGGDLGGERAAESGPAEDALLLRRWRERWGGGAARSGARRDRDPNPNPNPNPNPKPDPNAIPNHAQIEIA